MGLRSGLPREKRDASLRGHDGFRVVSLSLRDYLWPMHCFLTNRIETPIGDMVLVARDGVLLLLELQDSKDRVARDAGIV